MTERTDAERWEDAESIVDGSPTEFALQQLQRFRRRMKRLTWSLAGLMVIALAGTTLAAVFLGDDSPPAAARPRTPLWQEITGLSLTAAGMVVVAVGLIRYLRSGRWRAVWRSPALVLTRRQRRELSRQIRGRLPLDPARAKVARHVAELPGGARVWSFYRFLFSGGLLQQIGQLVTARSTGRAVYTGGILMLYGLGAALVVVRQRQIREFLEKTRDLV